MAEDQAPAQDSSDNGGHEDGFTPPATQAELNKIIADRVARERAKYADYGDLKSKASKLDELEQANKTEAERLAEEASTARAEAEAARAELLRYRVAAAHGITDADDIDLFLTGKDEETLTKQAERLAARSEDSARPRSPRPDPNQGRPGSGPASTADMFAAAVERQFTR